MVAVTWSAWVWFFRGGFWSFCWPVSPAGRSSTTLNPSCSLSGRVQKWPGQLCNPQRSSGALYTYRRHIGTFSVVILFACFKRQDTFIRVNLCASSRNTPVHLSIECQQTTSPENTIKTTIEWITFKRYTCHLNSQWASGQITICSLSTDFSQNRLLFVLLF